MRKLMVMSIVALLPILHELGWPRPVPAAEPQTDATVKRVSLTLDAGPHQRSNVLVSTLVDAGAAQSVYVEYADGKLGRAQLVEPGMRNAASRGAGKKELHFIAPDLAPGESATVVALLSERPVEGRTYVWTGEPRRSRRLSCMQCHQGLAIPTAEELRREREMLDKTGQVPPLELPRLFPTSQGQDSRWHKTLGQYLSSACWECHGRDMVQYEYGQSLERDSPWAPDPPHLASATPPAVRSVFHTVFRVRHDRTTTHPLPLEDVAAAETLRWRIQYGFERAAVGGQACSGIVQQHVGTLAEEAGKFLGRHCVLIDWVGNMNGQRTVVAREERELMVKDLRGRDGSYAKWIDFVSTLRPTAGTVRLDGADPRAGFRFVPSLDQGTVPEYREGASWRAITFVSEETTYTAVCFNHPRNPQPLPEEAAEGGGAGEQSAANGRVPAVGYACSSPVEETNPVMLRYRLWIQGGHMPTEEIQAMADDLVDPIAVSVK